MNIIPQQEFQKEFEMNRYTNKDVAIAIFKTINHFIDVKGADLKEIPATKHDVSCKNAINCINSFSKNENQIQLIFFGETHTCAEDRSRGQQILREMAGKHESLVVFERGMESIYQAGGLLAGHEIVRETNIIGAGYGYNFGVKERSMIIAGYLVACIAKMNINKAKEMIDAKTNVILFFGEMHRDILDSYFDYFSRHTTASFLLAKKREYLVVRSLCRQ